jgi:hypothetical protein
MAKFRKKPVVIEAVQWTGKNHQQVLDFTEDDLEIFKPHNSRAFLIPTSEGEMRAEVGDWIIKEPFPTGNRRYYPCKPDIFEKTYEPAQ